MTDGAAANHFELHIIFTGLCFFARDRSDETKLHVLLIDPSRTSGAGGGHAGSHGAGNDRSSNVDSGKSHMPEHFVNVFYHDKYLPTPTGNNKFHPKQLEGAFEFTVGGNGAGGSGGSKRPMGLPPHVPNLGKLTRIKFDERWLTKFDSIVAAVVTLSNAEVRQVKCCGPFEFPDELPGPNVRQYMTWQSGYSLDLSGTSLTIKPSSSDSVDLVPRERLIELRMKSVIEAENDGEDPPYPGARTTMDHFLAYYDLLEKRPTDPPPTPRRPDKSKWGTKSSYFTCTQGGAAPPP